MAEAEPQREGSEAPEPPGGARLRRPALATSFAALALGVGLLVHLRAWAFVCDDAFISFRYARNLGRHGALVYNVDPLERVEGYTNLLWVLILALGELVGLAPETLAPVLTAAASLVSLLLVALISAALRRRFGPKRKEGREAGSEDPRAFALVDLLGPALLVLTPEFVVWASGGLETSLALALALAAMVAWLRGRIEWAAACSALAGLTRVDALLGIAAFGVGWLAVVGLTAKPRPAIPWRRVAIASLVFAAPLLASLVVRKLYYGEWLPNTWAVKHHGALLRDSYGVGYLKFWADRLGLIGLAPLALLLRPRHLILALPIATQLVWAWSIGGDFMAYGRFLLPATTLLALLIGLALAEGRESLAARVPRRWLDGAWAALALALVVGLALRIPDRLQEDREHAHLHIDYEDPASTPGFEGVTAMHRFAVIRLAAGEAFARALPSDTRITVGAAGALPYTSGLTAYDAYGLIDPSVVATTEPRRAGARPGHQLHASIQTMLAREPDLLCHLGYAGVRAPPRSLARRMGAPRGWTGWACVETGAIADRRAEGGRIPSHYYCCMRPLGRFEELDPQ
jgi:arabinofuranosyltransferase